MYCQQNVEKNYNIKIANKSLEKVVQLKYLEMTLKYRNYIHEEIKEDLIRGMHATILSRTFPLLVWYQKIYRLKYTKP
jgi:hypothetical protein